MIFKFLDPFLRLEAAGGIILFIAAVLSMIWANSSLAFIYSGFVDQFLFWINEGLMAVFFLLVGLELKRGFLEGHLSQFSQILLPAGAAVGGMIIPALIYFAFNHTNTSTLNGWATPVATDIAFALGALSLFGKKVPRELKLFLLALAIFDDLGAIIIITLFYAQPLQYLFLFQSAILVMFLSAFNALSVRSLIPYLLVGAWLWLSLIQSGLHPTLAGVLLAFTIPGKPKSGESPLNHLEKTIHPWVSYLIMPLFALANTGFSIKSLTLDSLRDMIVLGIALGLFLGKQVGVFGFSWLLIQFNWARLPRNTSWLELYGVSLLCGIGFTMSLFLGTLAFQNNDVYLSEVRFGVIAGSLLSGLAGILILHIRFARKKELKP